MPQVSLLLLEGTELGALLHQQVSCLLCAYLWEFHSGLVEGHVPLKGREGGSFEGTIPVQLIRKEFAGAAQTTSVTQTRIVEAFAARPAMDRRRIPLTIS